MRKLVLLLLCITLLSYCPEENGDRSYVRIPMKTVLKDVDLRPQFKASDDIEYLKRPEFSHENVNTHLFTKATEAFTIKISDPFRQILKGVIADEKEKKALDLSLPALEDDLLEADAMRLLSESNSTLPDLFATPDNKKESPRASIGGRLLMDEQNPTYTMDGVLGAEVSLELKVH